METEVSFGIWLQKRRKALDFTREELAPKIGCSVSALRKIESDERRPSKQLAELLSNALDIPVDERPIFIRVARGELSLERLNVPHPSSTVKLLQPPQPFAKSIPIPPTPLIGREIELTAIQKMLDDSQCRLITLTGLGGSGKTRLAIEIAMKQSDHTAFVPLAGVNSSSLMVPAIADALEFSFHGNADPKIQLVDYLREKQILLVLDNMEHLLDGADLIVQILQSAPHLKMICTSREPFNVRGEWIFEVGGLNYPKGDEAEKLESYSANILFLQCAQRVVSGFSLTNENLPMLTRICALVEGMPLAIELAAAWVRTLSCREIAQEIERDLDILTTSARGIPERHRSMQAVFDHSWDLLSEDERRALRRLSVFRGGFTREAAEGVVETSLSVLSSLVSKSLVRFAGAGRYDLHELIRQYAEAHLAIDPDEFAAVRDRHFAFYLEMAEAADSQLRGSRQLEWLSRLEQEHDNLRAALEWSLKEHNEEPNECGHSALRLAGALRWFWQIRGHFHEGCNWLKKALDHSQSEFGKVSSSSYLPLHENLQEQARALEGYALLANSLGNHSAAHTLAEESLRIYQRLDGQRGIADVLMILGQTLRWQGNMILSHARLEEALALYREVDDPWSIARSLYLLGTYLADFGGDTAGRVMLEESSAILESLGDKYILVSVLVSLGIIDLISCNYSKAQGFFNQSLILAREIRDPWEMANALTNLGCISRIQGDYVTANSHFEEAFRTYQEGGRGVWCADPLCALAENDIVQGHLEAARMHLQEASAYVEQSENSWVQTLLGYFQGLLAYYEGDMERSSTWLEKVMTLAKESHYKPDIARSLVTLGHVMHARGETAQATVFFNEGLDLFYKMDSSLGIAMALEGLAGLTLSDDVKSAARLLGAAEAIRTTISAPLPPVDRPSYERNVTAIRAQLGKTTFNKERARGRTEPWAALVEEILKYADSAHQSNS